MRTYTLWLHNLRAISLTVEDSYEEGEVQEDGEQPALTGGSVHNFERDLYPNYGYEGRRIGFHKAP